VASNPTLDKDRVTPLGELRLAIEFYAGAVAMHAQYGDELLFPTQLNLGQSIELALKALLLHAGETPTALAGRDKNHLLFGKGHDVGALLELAKSFQFRFVSQFGEQLDDMINSFSEAYAGKTLGYFYSGGRQVLLPSHVGVIAFELIEAIAKCIEYGEKMRLSHCGGAAQQNYWAKQLPSSLTEDEAIERLARLF
jgi:hypothetical protein